MAKEGIAVDALTYEDEESKPYYVGTMAFWARWRDLSRGS